MTTRYPQTPESRRIQCVHACMHADRPLPVTYVCTTSGGPSVTPHVGVADRRFTQWRSLGTMMTRRSSLLPRHHPKKQFIRTCLSLAPVVVPAIRPYRESTACGTSVVPRRTRGQKGATQCLLALRYSHGRLSRFVHTHPTPPHRRCRWDAMTPCCIVVLTMYRVCSFFLKNVNRKKYVLYNLRGNGVPNSPTHAHTPSCGVG